MADESIKVSIEGLELLSEDIKTFGRKLTASIAEYSEQELSRNYSKLLDEYYEEYSPIAYSRTDQLHNKSYRRYGARSKKGLRASGGVAISSSANGRMRYYNGFSPETVIGWFLEGNHGGCIDGGLMPWNSISRVQDYILAEICDGRVGTVCIAEAKGGLKIIRG